jgi:phosphoribosyl 1,2-cyclic phosphodiesterase
LATRVHSMGLRFCLLASGSKGNAIYIESQGQAVLVDNGLSGVELLRRLESSGLEARRIKAIILTHEHRDHSSGVGIFARKLRVPVVATRNTWAACPNKKKVIHNAMEAGRQFELSGLQITPFSIPHDAADPVGLVIQAGAARLGLCTDLGWATRLVEARLAGCNALVLESNHDPQMLSNGPYKEWLKQRVRSRHGHLSNQEGAALLSKLHHADLREVVLAHLSEVNNTPELAKTETEAALAQLDSDANLNLACQNRPSLVIEI